MRLKNLHYRISQTLTRADALSWYVTTASLGSAIGTEVSGRVVDFLQHIDGWTFVDAYHTVFWVYVVMDTLNTVFMLLLSTNCEAVKAAPETEASEVLLEERGPKDDGNGDEDDEDPQTAMNQEPQTAKNTAVFAQISRETRSVMYKLWFLLTVDSHADGMTPMALTTYYMNQKFHTGHSTLGDITSISYFLASCSTIFAGPLSRHLELINNMVFTHLPSSVAVLLFPAPSNIYLTVALFFLRTGLNNMDQAPRSAFIAAVVKRKRGRRLWESQHVEVVGSDCRTECYWIAF